MTTKDQVRQALLEILSGAGDELGFTDAPRAKTVFVGQHGSSNWYFWNPNAGRGGEAEPIEQSTLRGRLTGIRSRLKQSDRYEDSLKLRIDIEADRAYSIEVGMDTVFAKGFLSAVVDAGRSLMGEVVSIETSASDTVDKVVFCNLYAGGARVRGVYDRDADVLELYNGARAALGLEPDESAGQPSGSSNTATSAPPARAPRARQPM